MSDERQDRVDEVFQAALDLPPEQRAAFVERRCAGDTDLKRAVDRLLGAHERAQAGRFMADPIFKSASGRVSGGGEGPTAGQLIGRYRLLRPLGAGGMGQVFLAHDESLDRRVALKLMTPGRTHGDDGLRRFRQEALAVSALNHPNILTVHEVGPWDQGEFLATEFVEGMTLRELLDARRPRIAEATDIAVQIASALSAAHAAGVVHRDVKPENVVVRPDGLVKVLDFGIATYSDKGERALREAPIHTATGMVLGTAGYMSPEQVRGEPADARSDIFALGAVIYEMLSGRRAFRGRTSADTMSAILNDDPQELTGGDGRVPPPLDRVVRRCLEKRPDERFQSARDVGFALEAVSAPAAPLAAAPPRRWWRERWIAAAVALALLAGVGAGVVAARRVSAPSPVSFRQLTSRRGTVHAARFAPDGQSVVYAAAWEGEPIRLFLSRIGSPGFTPLALPPANVLAMSAAGEMAITVGPRWLVRQWPVRGTLARVPLAGGAPREVLEEVDWADWAPDGRNMAVVHEAGGRARLEYPIGKVLYETDRWISHARISAAGDLVAFLDHAVAGDDAGSVKVVDRSGRQTTLSAGWASIQGLAWHPARREVWFTATRTGGNNNLWAVTLSGRERLITQAPARLTLHDISAAGRVLFSRESIRIGVIGLAPGETRERDYSWFDATSVWDLSPEGTTLLLAEDGGGTDSPSIYLRRMDGSPAVRLGEGSKAFFSPDRKWALSMLPTGLVLLPTGPGEETRLEAYGIGQYREARWLPDGTRVVFAGSEPGHGVRLYVQDLSGGRPRALTPEGVSLPPTLSNPVSPEGAWVTAMREDRTLLLYSVEGASSHGIVGLEREDEPILWADYGRVLYVLRTESLPGRVFRLDLKTGRRELWKQILPPDPAGAWGFASFVLTRGPRAAYAYTYFRQLSELYVAEGLN